MACLACQRGRIKCKIEKEKTTYYCANCTQIIEYCHRCGAEMQEGADDVGKFIGCVEHCGWKDYVLIDESGPYSSRSLKALMERAPRP